MSCLCFFVSLLLSLHETFQFSRYTHFPTIIITTANDNDKNDNNVMCFDSPLDEVT